MRIFRRLLHGLVALAFTVWSASDRASSTTVIAVGAPDAIVLGADSKATDNSGTNRGTLCKIGGNDDVIFANSGLLEWELLNFSARDMAAAAISGAGSLVKRIASFESSLAPPLIRLLNEFRRREPVLFGQNYGREKPSVSSVFAGYESGIPHIHARTFFPNFEPLSGVVSSLIVQRTDYVGALAEDAYIILGSQDRAKAELRVHPSMWDSMGSENAVQRLIELEITSSPHLVGPPIAVRQITKNGTRWLRRGTCGS